MGQCVAKKEERDHGNPKPKKGKLSKSVIEDLLKHTKFTREEILHWHGAFRRAVPTGRMNHDLYQRIVLALVFTQGPEKFSDCGAQLIHHLDLTFRQYDVDGDRTITFREFMLGMSISTKGSLDEKISWAFSLYDIDKDGIISFDEMQEILDLTNKAYGQDLGQKDSMKLVTSIFDYLDADKDGVITVKEFILGLKSRPELFEFFTGATDILSTVDREQFKRIKVGAKCVHVEKEVPHHE